MAGSLKHRALLSAMSSFRMWSSPARWWCPSTSNIIILLSSYTRVEQPTSTLFLSASASSNKPNIQFYHPGGSLICESPVLLLGILPFYIPLCRSKSQQQIYDQINLPRLISIHHWTIQMSCNGNAKLWNAVQAPEAGSHHSCKWVKWSFILT